jgi:hypothetical protein
MNRRSLWAVGPLMLVATSTASAAEFGEQKFSGSQVLAPRNAFEVTLATAYTRGAGDIKKGVGNAVRDVAGAALRSQSGSRGAPTSTGLSAETWNMTNTGRATGPSVLDVLEPWRGPPTGSITSSPHRDGAIRAMCLNRSAPASRASLRSVSLPLTPWVCPASRACNLSVLLGVPHAKLTPSFGNELVVLISVAA